MNSSLKHRLARVCLLSLVAGGCAPLSSDTEGGSDYSHERQLLEEELRARPDDVALRLQLVGSALDAGDLRLAGPHCFWIVENEPETDVASLCALATQGDEATLSAWERHLSAPTATSTLVERAWATFSTWGDQERAAGLLERGLHLEPANPMWSRQLLLACASVAGIRSLSEGRCRELYTRLVERAKTSPSSARERLTSLSGAAIASYHLGRLADAEEYARGALATTAEADDTSFDIHFSWTVLGHVALKHGDLSRAFECLRHSCNKATPREVGGVTPSLAVALVRSGLRGPDNEQVLSDFMWCDPKETARLREAISSEELDSFAWLAPM